MQSVPERTGKMYQDARLLPCYPTGFIRIFMANPFSTYGRLAQALPPAVGKSFYVVPSGSTLYSALSEQFPVDEDGVVRVYTDIASAISSCVTGRGDQIGIMPGTFTISTALAMSKSNVRLIGLGAPGTTILTASASDIIDLTGDGCEIANITFNLASTKIAIDMQGADYSNIHDCVFLSAVGGTASHFIFMNTTACNYNQIHDNRFISNLVVAGGAITQTSHITGLGIGNVIEHNVFVAGRVTTANAGAVTAGVVFAAAADAGNVVRWNSFTEFNGATFTAGINYGTTALGGSVMAYDNNLMLATAANAVVDGSNAANFANNIASGTV